MLNSAHIQNFRLFKDFQIDDLARVNLIVGKNNVGKSSLLEAINLLTNQFDPNNLRTIFLNILEDRGETQGRLRGYLLNHLFSNYTFEEQLPIHIHSNELSLGIYPLPKQHKIEFRSNQNQNLLEIEGVSANGIYKNDSMRPVYPSNFDTLNVHAIAMQGVDRSVLSQMWDRLQSLPEAREKEDEVMRTLALIDPHLERIRFLTSGDPIITLTGHPPVPIGNMGEGMNRVLGLIMTLIHAEQGYLLVDEIDIGLHYRVMTDMWRMVMETAVRLNIQVFATTHSYDCMRSFAEALSLVEDDRVGALFRLQRRGENIESLRFDAENIIYAIEQDIEMR